MTDRTRSARRPGAVGDWLFFLCLAISVSGLGVAILADWRQGFRLAGVGLLVAGGIRTVLPDAMAGMLRVRRKAVDVLGYAALGAALLALTVVVRGAR